MTVNSNGKISSHSNKKFIIGVIIMLGSIPILCSTLSFNSIFGLVPAFGGIAVFLYGTKVAVDGAPQ